MLWDLGSGQASRKLSGHRGHVTSISWYQESIFLTGAQDGIVRVWDKRSSGSGMIGSVPAHVVKGSGAGAVGDIEITGDFGPAGKLVVTAGADQRLQVLDPRKGFEVCRTLGGHRDFIYSLALAGNYALSGGGDGSLLVHDIQSGVHLCPTAPAPHFHLWLGLTGRGHPENDM